MSAMGSALALNPPPRVLGTQALPPVNTLVKTLKICISIYCVFMTLDAHLLP